MPPTAPPTAPPMTAALDLVLGGSGVEDGNGIESVGKEPESEGVGYEKGKESELVVLITVKGVVATAGKAVYIVLEVRQ